MSKRYLGDTIDIHAGGEDLIFPHHENEIAQSEAANGVPFANYWMHNAFLNIDNRKMSKSLGNFFTVREILDEYDPQVIRFFMLSVHYRSPLNFSRELVASAKNGYDRIMNCAENIRFIMQAQKDKADAADGAVNHLVEEASAFRKSFEAAMDDDFNTADAISAIFDLVRFINQNVDETTDYGTLETIYGELAQLMDVLGLSVEKESASDDEVSYIEEMIEKRAAAKKAKDYAAADAIRDELKAKGIILEDTREGVKWKKA